MKVLFNNQYNNYRYPQKVGCENNPTVTTPVFTGKLSNDTLRQISTKFSSFIRKYNNNQQLNKFSSNELITIMALEGTVAPIGFFSLSDKSPLIAKALLNHDRVSEVNDSIMSKILNLNYDDGITEEQAELFTNLLDIHYSDDIPLFTIQEALENSIDLSENSINMINNNSEKLKLIFSSLNRTGAGFLDCLSCSVALNEAKDNLTPDELITYYLTFNDAEDEYVLTWASLDKEKRSKMLNLLNESEFIFDVCQRNYNELIPDEQLLRRLEFLEEYKEEFTSIFTKITFPTDLLSSFYTEKHIKNSLDMLNSLTIAAKEYCIQNGSVYALFDYESVGATHEGYSIANLNDLKTAMEIFAQYDVDNIIDLDLDNLRYIPVMTNDMQQTLVQNLTKSYKCFSDASSLMTNKIFIKNLFNPDLEKNYKTSQNLPIDKILAELSLKCQNRNPEFVKISKEFLEGAPSINAQFSDMPGLNAETLREGLFAISKLQIASLYKLDKNTIKQKYVDKYISLLPKNNTQAMTFERTYIDRDFYSDLIVVKSAYYKFTNPYLLYNLLNLVTVTDAEYANLLLDKGFDNLKSKGDILLNLPYKTKVIIQDVFKHAKNLDSNNEVIKLSGKQKITLVTLISKYHGLLGDELNKILKASIVKTIPKTNDYILDYENFKTQVYISLIKILTGSKIDKANLANWDLDYFYLVANSKNKEEDELKLSVELLSKGILSKYILDKSTKYGKINANTEARFKQDLINYDIWLKGIRPETIYVNGKEFAIELFDRNYPNNLFMGNYTNCCTSLDGTHSEAVPNYILHTAFNVFLVKDSNGKIVATSRVFMSEIDSKPALIIDNIEASNDFTRKLTPEHEADFAQDIWNYIIKFADSISPKQLPIYMTSFCQKINLPQKPASNRQFKILGDVCKNFLYINSVAKVTDTSKEKRSNFYSIRER